jgi:hypothetical protein
VEAHTFLDNLSGLHSEEERLHCQSMAAIEASPALLDHLQVIEGAMDLVQILGRAFPQPTTDQQVVQLLGIRLFNASATSLKLCLAGYYQAGFGLIRDILETTHLLDFFLLEPAAIAVWQAGGRVAKQKFKPKAVRDALDRRDGWTTGQREAIYQRYCAYATHPTYAGVQLVAQGPQRLATYGPFYAIDTLGHFLIDLAKYLMHGTLVFARHFQSADTPQIIGAIGQFHHLASKWGTEHLDTPLAP